MKVGAEDRNKLIAAIALMVVAVLCLAYVFSGGSNPAAAVPPPAATGPRPAVKAKTGAAQTVASLDPTLRLNLLRSSEGVKYEGTGRNIFRAQADEPIPQPHGSVLTDHKPQPPPQPTGPPPPPPIPLKFYGFANEPGEPIKRVFLSKDGNIFIAREGDVVDRQYKIVRIGPGSVEIEDLLNNNKQTIPLSSQS